MTPYTRAREMLEGSKVLKYLFECDSFCNAHGFPLYKGETLQEVTDSIVSMTIESCKEAVPKKNEGYTEDRRKSWNACRTATFTALDEMITNK